VYLEKEESDAGRVWRRCAIETAIMLCIR
jgi:hypothetical protein